MTIAGDSQLLEPGSKVELWVFDATSIDVAAGILYFHGYNRQGPITWQGQEYAPWPVSAKGFTRSGERPASPSFTAGNIDGSLTSLCLMFDDLVGAKLIRKRTMSKYLDAVNFGGVNPTANPAEHYPDEIWFLDRKSAETHQAISWELSSALDFNGVSLPRRIITANQCWWQYRSPECSYAGGPVAEVDDTPTSNPLLDNCSRKPSGCKKRFGADNPLPYGGFAAAGLMRT